MPASPFSVRLALVGWLALVVVGLLVVTPGSTPEAVAAPASPTSASHPYSDPTWFPLRTPTRVGCTKDGCRTASDHGYDAIDLQGSQGDPVYAAGAGIAHVGGDSGTCSGSGEVGGGRWVWIDHGGGVVSRYHHLDAIAITEGQLVTPATRIGSMGHSGDVPPCTTNYLHFEVRHGGRDGQRVPFGSLRGCGAKGPLQLPQALGFSSWDDPGLHPVTRLTTPRLDSSCVTPDWMTSGTRPAPWVTRSGSAVRVGLDLPAGAQQWAVDLEIWRPSLAAWKTITSTTVPGSTSIGTFTEGVENGRRYRVQVAVHTGRGWSLWSTPREAVGVPSAPPLRYLEWKKQSSNKKSYLHYGWTRPDDGGSAVTGYTVARRCGGDATSLGSWKTTKVSAGTAYKNLRSLKKAKVCDVRIQARNEAGAGAWSAPARIRR